MSEQQYKEITAAEAWDLWDLGCYNIEYYLKPWEMWEVSDILGPTNVYLKDKREIFIRINNNGRFRVPVE